MRLFFDSRTLRPRMTGVGSYAFELLAALAASARAGNGPDRIRALVLQSSLPHVRTMPQFEAVEWIPTPVDYENHPSADLWLRFSLPKLIEPDEVFHGPAFQIPGGRQPFTRVVTIHDAGPLGHPGHYSTRFGAYMRWTIRRAIRHADHVIVPSAAVGADLSRCLSLPSNRVSVIPEAPASTQEPPWTVDTKITNAPLTIPSAPFFLSVGTIETRKDPLTAIHSLEKLGAPHASDTPPPSWIWIGGPGNGRLKFFRELRESSARDRFHCLGPRTRMEMEPVLQRASALVYPSLDEGFGLPPLEAMTAGVPAVVSDLPVLREVYGDAALYFPAGDPCALAAQLQRILGNAALREDLVLRGRAQAARFSWAETARQTLAAYGHARK